MIYDFVSLPLTLCDTDLRCAWCATPLTISKAGHVICSYGHKNNVRVEVAPISWDGTPASLSLENTGATEDEIQEAIAAQRQQEAVERG